MKTNQHQLPEGHPIHTYNLEAVLIHELLDEFCAIDAEVEFQKYYNVFNHLSTVEKRFQRKENQLFPFLEQKGWTNPSQNMWSFHDMIRELFKIARRSIDAKDFKSIKDNTEYINHNLRRLLDVERNVLFPSALSMLTDEDWIKMSQGEQEIGWMLATPPAKYQNQPEYIHPSADTTLRTDVVFDDKAAHYDEGYMTVEQVNLLFRTLPLDITYVDENDRVIFYNRGEERLFPRSAGIIGREVKFCHPPKSVDTVIKIVDAFKSGAQNEASFWINIKGRLIYIRYFAVRDAQKNYKGVIEMSQDITDIQKIDGERRLLAWK